MEANFCERLNAVLLENNAKDILTLNVEEKTKLAKYIIIATLSDSNAVRNFIDILQATLGKALRVEGITKSEWVVLDYDEAIIHLFIEKTRDKYNLEKLWKDYKYNKKEVKEKKKK